MHGVGSRLVIEVVFERHSTSEDNERGVASGWLPSRLSAVGREQARALGQRRATDGITVVFTSDLRRAEETAVLAFGDAEIPILRDWRLRECDYGERNGGPADLHVETRPQFLDTPYPGGESWRAAVARVGRFLDDVRLGWEGKRVLVVGHVATRWGLDHFLSGTPLEELGAREFVWREGWEYLITPTTH